MAQYPKKETIIHTFGVQVEPHLRRSLWERMPHSSYTSAAEDIVRNEGAAAFSCRPVFALCVWIAHVRGIEGLCAPTTPEIQTPDSMS